MFLAGEERRSIFGDIDNYARGLSSKLHDGTGGNSADETREHAKRLFENIPEDTRAHLAKQIGSMAREHILPEVPHGDGGGEADEGGSRHFLEKTLGSAGFQTDAGDDNEEASGSKRLQEPPTGTGDLEKWCKEWKEKMGTEANQPEHEMEDYDDEEEEEERRTFRRPELGNSRKGTAVDHNEEDVSGRRPPNRPDDTDTDRREWIRKQIEACRQQEEAAGEENEGNSKGGANPGGLRYGIRQEIKGTNRQGGKGKSEGTTQAARSEDEEDNDEGTKPGGLGDQIRKRFRGKARQGGKGESEGNPHAAGGDDEEDNEEGTKTGGLGKRIRQRFGGKPKQGGKGKSEGNRHGAGSEDEEDNEEETKPGGLGDQIRKRFRGKARQGGKGESEGNPHVAGGDDEEDNEEGTNTGGLGKRIRQRFGGKPKQGGKGKSEGHRHAAEGEDEEEKEEAGGLGDRIRKIFRGSRKGSRGKSGGGKLRRKNKN